MKNIMPRLKVRNLKDMAIDRPTNLFPHESKSVSRGRLAFITHSPFYGYEIIDETARLFGKFPSGAIFREEYLEVRSNRD
jgi:hypothetical protein